MTFAPDIRRDRQSVRRIRSIYIRVHGWESRSCQKEDRRKMDAAEVQNQSRIFFVKLCLFINSDTVHFSLGSNEACQIMSNILKANNSDTSYLHSPKNIQDSISLKNIPPQLQPAVPSSSSSTEEKTMAMTNPIPSTLPTEAEAAVLITHLSASMECNAAAAAAADTQVQDATNATPDPSIVWRTSEEPETRLRSKSRSTPPSGNGSEQEQDGSSVAYKRVKRPNPFARLSTQPRWHNQSYMLFLALRQHPERSLPRTELIKAALAMDKKISDELNLPKVFRGKVRQLPLCLFIVWVWWKKTDKLLSIYRYV
jgi:hypothetical protein